MLKTAHSDLMSSLSVGSVECVCRQLISQLIQSMHVASIGKMQAPESFSNNYLC